MNLERFNKAYIAAAVMFVALTLETFFGITLDDEFQSSLVNVIQAVVGAVISGGLVWLIPNRSHGENIDSTKKEGAP